jgi:hypothetical protein
MGGAVATGFSSPALRYSIDGAAGFIVIEPLSIAKAPALLTALRAIKTDPQFRSTLDVCVDCNSLREIPTRHDIRRLARLCGLMNRADVPSRWALIATWRRIQDAAFLFAHALPASHVTSHVFLTWSDALVWLRSERPPAANDIPWIGPSFARDELLRRSIAARQ